MADPPKPSNKASKSTRKRLHEEVDSSPSSLEPRLKKPKFASPPTIPVPMREEDSTNETKKDKSGFVYKYGNYSGYYGYRLDGAGNDPRIDLLQAEWFRGKKILDIGCNTGVLSIRIARRFSVESMHGVDIDKSLITRATRNLESSVSSTEAGPSDKEVPKRGTFHGGGKLSWNFGSASSSSEAAPSSSVSTPSSTTISAHEPAVTFEAGNYLTMPTEKASYDTILCFSVIKWIHLNWGDAGLRTLLLKARAELKENGLFILEVQPASSYKKVKNLTKTIRANYAANKIQPGEVVTIAKELGLQLVQTLTPPASDKSSKHGTVGFSRPIYVFKKVHIPTMASEKQTKPETNT